MPKNKRRFDYFDAFQQLTDLAVQEATMLIESLNNFTEASAFIETLRTMHTLENSGDDINHDIFSNSATDFMPPIDREDIVELAQSLDDIIDYIEDVLTHMYMYDIRIIPEDALKFATLIRKACKALLKAMSDFKNFKKSKKFMQYIVDINTYEEEADTLYQNTIRRLHTIDNTDVMHVLVWSRIFERMEKCCNECEHASNILATILLKNM